MREELFKCYCESRKVQLHISKILESDNLSSDEIELLQEITLVVQVASNKIKCFCEKPK